MTREDIEIILDPATGGVQFIYSEDAMRISANVAGIPAITRASRVEPVPGTTLWEADMSLSDGPNLGPFATRKEALDAEIDWLRMHRLGRRRMS